VADLEDNTDIDFSDVCRHYLGHWAAILSVIFSLIALLGGAVVYWVLMSNFLFHTVTFIHGCVSILIVYSRLLYFLGKVGTYCTSLP